jgi:hypothetical protein
MWEGFAYMERLPMYGKTSHRWEDFPHTGRLPRYVRVEIQIMGGIPRLALGAPGVPPVGHFAWPGSTPPKSLNDVLLITENICYHTGFGFHIWEDFPDMGRLPIHGKTSHTCEVLYMGRLPIVGKSSHRWEVFT